MYVLATDAHSTYIFKAEHYPRLQQGGYLPPSVAVHAGLEWWQGGLWVEHAPGGVRGAGKRASECTVRVEPVRGAGGEERPEAGLRVLVNVAQYVASVGDGGGGGKVRKSSRFMATMRFAEILMTSLLAQFRKMRFFVSATQEECMKDAVINGLAERIEFDIEQDQGGLLRPVFVKADKHSSPGMNVNRCAAESDDEGGDDERGGATMGPTLVLVDGDGRDDEEGADGGENDEQPYNPTLTAEPLTPDAKIFAPPAPQLRRR